METTTTEKTKIGERLKELRKAAGMSRETVAKALDTCEKTIWAHETGRTGIARNWLLGYAEVFGKKVEELIEGTDWVRPTRMKAA